MIKNETEFQLSIWESCADIFLRRLSFNRKLSVDWAWKLLYEFYDLNPKLPDLKTGHGVNLVRKNTLIAAYLLTRLDSMDGGEIAIAQLKSFEHSVN